MSIISEQKNSVYRKFLARTAEPDHAETSSDALNIVKSLIKEGATVASGGSMTLEETGITQLLRSGAYNYLDRAGKTGKEAEAVYRAPFSADVIGAAGRNKIVSTLNDAVMRVKRIAAPMNTARLGCETYCMSKGVCMALAAGYDGMTSGCRSESRICCSFVVSARQRVKDRIKVILVNEDLGY